MTSTAAAELLATMRQEFLPGPEDNRLVPLVAEGEAPLGVIGALAAGCGMDQAAVRAYRPLPGCQAYPAYVA